MTQKDIISLDAVLASILVDINDEELRTGFSRGWFISRIQEALEEIAISSFYKKLTKDIINWNWDADGFIVDYPDGCFNVREIYLFNGDCCEIENQVPVVWKRLYNRSHKKTGGTGLVVEGGTNYNPIYQGGGTKSNLYYANLIDGTIHFAERCSGYTSIRIVYNGVDILHGEVPVIPIFLRKFVRHYVTERYYFAMLARDRSYTTLWKISDENLNGDGTRRKRGSLQEAKKFVSSLNTFERQSLLTYLSQPNI